MFSINAMKRKEYVYFRLEQILLIKGLNLSRTTFDRKYSWEMKGLLIHSHFKHDTVYSIRKNATASNKRKTTPNNNIKWNYNRL